MRLTRRRFLVLSAAMAGVPRGATAHDWQGTAFGAPARITLAGPRAEAEAALAEVVAEIARIEALASLARPDSALVALNARGRLDPAPPGLVDLLGVADRVWRATGGLFDPTVQPLWQALADGTDPAAARAAIGWDRVRLGPGRILLDPGQALTLNGIAQGWAADRLRARLAARGFTRALVDMGEFAALGGPWRLGIEDPALGPCGTLTLEGGALATSSPGALGLAPGQGHILGPQGQRARWSTVSVRAGSAALADALSTALCLAPRAAIPAILARLEGAAGPVTVVLVSPDGEVERLGG